MCAPSDTRLTRVEHTGPAGLLDYFDYTLDPNGNPTRVESTDGTETQTSGSDGVNHPGFLGGSGVLVSSAW